MQPNILQTPITYLPGVGPAKAELLKKELNIHTFEHLLYHFPYKYIDKSKIYNIADITPDTDYIQVKGTISNLKTIGDKKKQRLTALLSDATGQIELIWFQGIKYVKQNIKPATEYLVFGKPAQYGGFLNIPHPEMDEAASIKPNEGFTVQGFYHTTEKMKKSFLNSKAIFRLQQNLLKAIWPHITETLPPYIIQKFKLLPNNQCYFNIHFPKSAELLKMARYRLKLEELFYIQLSLLHSKLLRKKNSTGYIFKTVGTVFNEFYNKKLPFALTNAQKRVLKEIRNDFLTGKQSNRLLQGDVGSGKTLVALMAMLIAVDNQFQSCIMAPTEILAQQHYQTITKFLDTLPVKVAILTGSTKTKLRKQIDTELKSGEIKILIGTHAIIEDPVVFKNLGLAIIDEQHRFGVEQRARLWKKNSLPPHVIVMTATPIPRTLAMTLYGDLEISVIDELPPGRKPITTYHMFDSKRLKVFSFMREQIALGRQIYIVYPLIYVSDKLDYKDLEDGLASISRAFPSPQYAISVLHGKMKNEEKEKAMQLFGSGQTQIMVATTVIEVGVNVPNASVMIIENAEKFGLSQLHQLRGRVGRGADQSYCILMTPFKLTKDSIKRIQTMVRTNNGFEIAEEDLKLRGPGDLEGKQQSGMPFNLHIANLAKDGAILQTARNLANDILDTDPELTSIENKILKEKLVDINNQKINLAQIS